MGAIVPLRIGSRVNNSTVNSVLFVGTNNKLAQDNIRLSWDDTLKIFTVMGTFLLGDGSNIELGQTHGTTIGTTTTQKLAFFGALPVIQQFGGMKIASPTYGTNEQNMLQTVFNAMITYGLLGAVEPVPPWGDFYFGPPYSMEFSGLG